MLSSSLKVLSPTFRIAVFLTVPLISFFARNHVYTSQEGEVIYGTLVAKQADYNIKECNIGYEPVKTGHEDTNVFNITKALKVLSPTFRIAVFLTVPLISFFARTLTVKYWNRPIK